MGGTKDLGEALLGVVMVAHPLLVAATTVAMIAPAMTTSPAMRIVLAMMIGHAMGAHPRAAARQAQEEVRAVDTAMAGTGAEDMGVATGTTGAVALPPLTVAMEEVAMGVVRTGTGTGPGAGR